MKGRNQDYLNFTAISSIFNRERIIFSSMLMKYNDENYRQERALVLTDGAIYNVKKTQVQRRIRYEDLEAMTTSTTSSEFVLHVKASYDYRFLSYDHRTEIIETILYILVAVRKLCTAFKIYEVELINLNTVMTTKNLFKNKRVVRPPEKYAKIMDLEQFNDKKAAETERSTNVRKRTTMLYKKDKKDETVDVCIEDFEMLKILGKGAFGKVILAQKKDTSKIYAIKVLLKKHIIDQDQLDHTKAEKMILTHVNHPFLVGLDYAFQTDERLYFVLQFMKGGELFQHLRKLKRFSEPQAKFYAASIVLGLGHLHNKNYIYRDLKLENLLLDEKGYAMLTDFGLAKFIKSDEKAMTFCGTPEYLSPEVILGKGHNRPADWWSLGILIYEMMFGLPPFYTANMQQMYRKIIREEVSFKPGINISANAKDIILKLLNKSPENRLGSQADSLEVVSHPWFNDIDMAMLTAKTLKAPYIPDLQNWEKNFDKDFINEELRQSDVGAKQPGIDVEDLKKFQADFATLNFNRDKDAQDN
jgi:serum/glucocorticoid-regulated kinase 2